MQLLDGKKVSEDLKNEIAAEVAQMKAKGEKVPHLAAIIVGNDGASLTYVGSKVKSCERVGFESTLIKMPSTTSETELLKKIKELNEVLIADAELQASKGNKAAGTRARKASLELEKALKEFRKVSLEESKK